MVRQPDGGGITWTNITWNVVRGCSRVSHGCERCYAERIAARFSGPGQPYEGLARRTTDGGRWTGEVRLVPELLDAPLRWKKPRRIFVNSMSDLFHEALPDEAIDQVFAIMALAPQHCFQVLTKRAARMRAYFAEEWRWVLVEGSAQKIYHERTGEDPSMGDYPGLARSDRAAVGNYPLDKPRPPG